VWVEVCDRCKGYLKVIVSFTPTPADLLPIEDLATLHLDYIAQAHGYKRAAGHGFCDAIQGNRCSMSGFLGHFF